MLRLQDVSLMRGVRVLYSHATLLANPGERIGLVGENGCGKSSLLAAILGDVSIEAGEISAPDPENIGHVAQDIDTVDDVAIDWVLSGHAPLVTAKKALAVAKDDMSAAAAHAALAELKAIRAILDSPALEESRRQEQQAKEKAERDAVENFALVSEDLNELLAREAEEEARNAEAQEEVQEQQEEEVTAPHSYDLGAIGVDSEDFLQPSPKIGDMKIASEEKSEEIQKEEKPKVDTSHLVVPPLPGERQGFMVGMKVPKNHDQSLIYTSPMMWKKK